ncbi:MAG: [protein-PII] uridylyltransferase [Xanthomonadales bacterium]|nr:[protein-PII] uridylyltransferase [Gammaproteobacteria bacterium]NNL94088.1 [protein-PII] uridylyltransferase [Xanthomonadales bacterium]
MPNQGKVSETEPATPAGASLLPDLESLKALIEDPAARLESLKSAINSSGQSLAQRFANGEPVAKLVAARAGVVDQLLVIAWQALMPDGHPVALLAVGGYGRGELHPHSDVDLMILVDDEAPGDDLKQSIEQFFTLLWDAGLYLGHSVRNVGQCVQEAEKDVVTATNLMEARLLQGDSQLFSRMQQACSSNELWPAAAFFQAKYQEQVERHERFGDTAYNLEPNIKEGPGGLRDIQMISWVCQRHFGEASLHGLVDHGFLNEAEYRELHAGRQFLWEVRFALHVLSGRPEDRLLFEYQREVAEQLGFGEPGDTNEAVEAFMQRYYRVVMRLERLNDVLLQLFREKLVDQAVGPGEPLGEHFVLINGYLGLNRDSLFLQRPAAMVEVFVLLARRPDVRGLRASAIRAIHEGLRQLRNPLQEVPGALQAFLKLLRQAEGIYTQLQRMNRYGVLAALLPAFSSITGRMQFDLFHAYTVDQHILFVVRNLRRFAYGKYAPTYPGMAQVFREIQKPELLYLAALFHDIAKGRGGDHSELGAVDAAEFCRQLGLDSDETKLVAWLVEHHLLMSQTAQRKDISDPEVVQEFAGHMAYAWRLRYLYLLTVADISATSPKLWNSWKSGLLRELYQTAHLALASDGKLDADYESRLAHSRALVLDRLKERGLSDSRVERSTRHLPEGVFLRLSTGQLTWAIDAVCNAADPQAALVAVRRRKDLGISEVLVSAPDYTGLFASSTAIFDEMGLNVLTARVFTGSDKRAFDLFQVLNARGKVMADSDSEKLVRKLQKVLLNRELVSPVTRRVPRRLRPFIAPPRIGWDTARSGTVTALELSCTDQPGLLSQLASAMVACEIRIHDAMIATLGDRVEDTFLVTDQNNQLLDEAAKAKLVEAMKPIWNRA